MQSSTLLEVMAQHVATPDDDKALHCWNGASKSYDPVSYATLSRRAFAFGARLVSQPGGADQRVVMIACHTPYATLLAFYGAISVGAIPMIFPMPLSLGSHEALTERIKHWGFAFAQPALLVLEQDLTERFHEEIPAQIDVLRVNADPTGDWDSLSESANGHRPLPADVAFYQTTSSSTGDHKAVAISHGNIIANVVGIRRAQKMSVQERMATWLPLFHDMGLVGTVLFSFGNNYPLLIMTPTQFVKRPALWLKGMDQYRCTIATAPNFGFDYCTRLVSDKDVATLDLNCVKHLFIGAEPIRVSTVQGFVDKFTPCGISAQTIRPAYGLAESTIITTMTDPESVSNFICLEADSIGINEPLKILDRMTFDDPKMLAYDAAKAIAVCSAGTQIEGMTVEIVDEQGQLIERQNVAGEIAISGTSVALGYVFDGEAGRADPIDRFPEGRLRTGDMGAIVDGELYILERIKNIVIRNGENFLVSALEEQLAELLSISHEHIAVFESNIHDPGSDIVVLVERHAPLDDDAVNNLLVAMPKEAFPINKILLSKAREIPRTTSGKKRHFYCRKLYQKDGINFQQQIDVSPQRIMQAMNAVAAAD
ncbi:MAG: AMP-binding protein [Gammaproteobacteria bacterium]|nr:AMP-binding protein [Gammaproteobacteria bacterium]